MNPFATQPKAISNEKPASILLADDEPAVRLVLSFLLRRLGYEVVVAEDGAQAVAIFAENPRRFGTVLLDVQMPGMNGITAMEKMRSLAPDVRVILTSGMPWLDVVQDWSPTPPWVFLPKPFNFSDVRELLPAVAA